MDFHHVQLRTMFPYRTAPGDADPSCHSVQGPSKSSLRGALWPIRPNWALLDPAKRSKRQQHGCYVSVPEDIKTTKLHIVALGNGRPNRALVDIKE